MNRLRRLSGLPPLPLIGVVHLRALPGAPGFSGDLEAVIAAAAADIHSLAEGGVDAVVIENFGDAPFFPDQVPAHTLTSMTRVVSEICGGLECPFGINVLRNDARGALAVAAATGAAFVRVNVHTGAMLTDQGLLQGRAHETIRYRAELGLDCALFADVLVKHATPLGTPELDQLAHDTAARGLADALIVSGSGTGRRPDLDEMEVIRRSAPETPLLIGSGLNLDNLSDLLAIADGAIVGTALKRDGKVHAPVSPGRALQMAEAFAKVRQRRTA